MSAGAFITKGYLASYGAGTAIHPIRIQPETEGLKVNVGGSDETNTGEPIADITNPISAVISRGRNARGLNARLIRVQFTATPPTGYKINGVLTLPVLNKDIMGAPEGATGEYLGVAIKVVGLSPEKVK